MSKYKNNLPCNISHFLQKYKLNMKGNPNSVLKIQHSVNEFNKSRQQSSVLQRIQIFPSQNEKKIVNDQLYLVRIKGRRNTYYQGRIIKFYLFIFDSFPQEPPEIIAPFYFIPEQSIQKAFLHLNMDGDGHVCSLSNQKDKQYFKSTTIKDILIELQNMIYNPNISSSYQSQLFNCYKEKGDNSEYFKKLNLQAKYMEYFEDQQSDSNSDDS